jgi:hypothetical protein
MVVTVNIPDEIAAQAKARGLSLEAYVQEILAQQLAGHPVESRKPRTPEDIRAWLDSLAQFSDKIPRCLRRFHVSGFTRTMIRWRLPRVW